MLAVHACWPSSRRLRAFWGGMPVCSVIKQPCCLEALTEHSLLGALTGPLQSGGCLESLTKCNFHAWSRLK